MRNFKKLLSLVLCMAMMLSVMVVGAGAAFKDQSKIKNTEAVDVCSALNIINGYTDGSYKPEGNITRAEACKMICVALNGGKEPVLPTKATPTFSDVRGTSAKWAEGYIESCVSQGIVAGIGGGKFDPNGNVTGSQFAKMLLIALGYNAKHAEFLGAAWEVNVNVKATQKDLYHELEGMDVSAALTRDNAAQMVWNALQALTVEYDYTLVSDNGSLSSQVTVKDTKDTLLWEKYSALIEDESVLTGVKYDDKNDDYDTTVKDMDDFNADKDYSDLMGQNVKVIYKAKLSADGKSYTFDTLYGIYATDKNQTVTAVVGDIEGTIAAKKTVEIDDVEYDMADTVSVIAENGAAYTDTLEKHYEVTLIDNDDDDKYEVVVVNPFVFDEVTSLTSDKIYFKNSTSEKKDDCSLYDGIAKDDYVLVTDDDYTVSGDVEVVAPETISGEVTYTKNDADKSIQVGGTWYKSADLSLSPKAGHKLTSAVVVNGYYFTYDTSTSDTAANTAVVLAVADKTEWNSNFYKVDLLFANGETKTTTAKVVDENGDVIKDSNTKKPVAPDGKTLYIYEADGDGYALTEVTNGKQIDVGTAPAIEGTYSSETNKLTYTEDSTDKEIRVATDAVVYAVYTDDGVVKGKVVTGADADAWKNIVDGYTVEFAYADKTVEVMYIALTGDKVPGTSSNEAYAVVLETPVKNSDGKNVTTLWTKDGIVEDVVVTGDAAKKNAAYEYTTDGTEYDLDSVDAIVGAVTDIDGAYITVLMAGGVEEEYKLVDDTAKLLVDTKDSTGATSGDVREATEFEANRFYANVIIVENTDEAGELDLIVIDVDNELQNAADESIVLNKVGTVPAKATGDEVKALPDGVYNPAGTDFAVDVAGDASDNVIIKFTTKTKDTSTTLTIKDAAGNTVYTEIVSAGLTVGSHFFYLNKFDTTVSSGRLTTAMIGGDIYTYTVVEDATTIASGSFEA